MIERVSVIKAARIGYSTTLVASIGAVAVNDPSPILLLMPTDDDARGIAVDDIDPAFRDTPALRNIMRIGRFDGRNTLTQRAMLGGGSLKILSARAPRNLRRHTARVLFCDEVDGMEITSEGDPIKLAEKRTTSFADRKIVVGSTPTDEATSIVAKRYEESDQRIFETPCPECGEAFEIEWEHISWPKGQPEKAVCNCPHCGSEIEERHKPSMVEAGEWRATKPEVKGHAGFRVSALVSLFANASWGKLAAEYERAVKVGPSELMVFWNTSLGRVWSNAVGSMDENELLTRIEPFGIVMTLDGWEATIPEEVLYITCGVDVQVDRFEGTLWGWSADGQRWVLGHFVVRGSTKLETTWAELDAVLGTTWEHPLGNEIGIEATCIDSGDGNRTQEVYDFCGPRQGRRIVAIKGKQGPIPVIKASTGRRKRIKGATLFIVGVDQVKTDILTALSLEKGAPSCIRFSNSLDEVWFRQFVSERRVVKYPKGRPTIEFERISGRAAEALDASVYAVAARHLCRFDYERRLVDLTKEKKVERTSLKDRAARLSSLLNG